jgi:putative ABC transport system permease protein
MTVEQQISEGFRQERLLATLSTFFALLAALLAAIGLFGVLSFSVNQRFREMGIWMALGASPGQVFGIVIRDVLLFGGLGFALAIPAIYCMTRAVAAVLFGVPWTRGQLLSQRAWWPSRL